MTYPDPNQTISLEIDVENLSESKKKESASSGVENLVFRVGDALPVKAGPILDRNGLPVPDGTVVYFMIDHLGENEQSTILEVQTKSGIATMSYPLQSYGRVEIRAQSDPAKNSDIFVLDITSEEGSVISQITPTPIPTLASPNEAVNKGILDDQTKTPEDGSIKTLPGTMQWFFASIAILGIAYGIYLLTQRFYSLVGGTIIALYAVIAGYGCLMWFQLNLPGSFQRTNFLDLLYLLLWVSLFTCLGAGIGVGRQARRLKKPVEPSGKKADHKTDESQSGGNPE
jgi:hypothetical protein